jgi:aspartate racemase
MKTLGIIGGTGPLATAYFLDLLVKRQKAGKDSDYIPVFVYNNPYIPDRTEYILGKSGKSPYPEILRTGMLLRDNCDCIALPCVTAHIFCAQLEKDLQRPVYDMIEETAAFLRKKQMKNVGVLATDGTIAGGYFENVMKNRGISLIYPDRQAQSALMAMIYDGIKAGEAVDVESFLEIAKDLRKRGAETVLIGCTELSVLRGRNNLDSGFVDMLDILVDEIIWDFQMGI